MIFLTTSTYADIIGGIEVKPDYQNDEAVQKALVSYQKILDESGLTITKEQPCEETDSEYEKVWEACNALDTEISRVELRNTEARIAKLDKLETKLDQENALKDKELKALQAENRKLDQDIKSLKAIKKASNL